MNDLQFIPLKDIEMIKNYRDVEPVSEKDPDVIELSQSFLKLGVLQPVLLRPGKLPGKYQLIFGHRRYMGCRVARLEMVPANIKDVADDDILELQVTENLQRKDVHPLDEAIAFRSLIKDKGYTADDISARFGKKLEFVTLRLKLNDLITELQKMFKKNELSQGQALVLCRLKVDDQKEVFKHFTGEMFKTASVWDVSDWINKNITRQLSSAPFKRDDETLFPKAGPCTTCMKRSGCNTLLFSDLKEDDRCFDKVCFQTKLDAFFLRQLQELIETKPNIHLIEDSQEKLPKEVATLIKQMGVTILNNDKWDRYGYGKNKSSVKGFYLSGYYRGKTETIYVAGAAKKAVKGGVAAKRTVADIDLEISGIKDRQKRAKELDLEKIHKVTLERLEKKTELKKPGLKHQGLVDRGIMIFLLLHKAAGSQADRDIRKTVKAMPKEPGHSPHAYQIDYIKKLGALTDDDIAFMVRVICLDHYGNKNLVNGIDEDDTTLRLMAEYSGVDLKSIEAEQKTIADKRIERADKRLETLKAEKKLLEEKKPAKVEKKGTAKKTEKKATGKTAYKKDKDTGLEYFEVPGGRVYKGVLDGDEPEDQE